MRKPFVVLGLVVLVLAGGVIVPFSAQAAPATKLNIITVVTNKQSGSTFSVQVEALDNSNVRDTDFAGQITLSASATGGSNFFGGDKVATANSGLVTFSGLQLRNAANGYTITATATGLASDGSNAFNVTATHLIVTNLNDMRAGDSFNVVVGARDIDNAVAENFTGLMDISANIPAGGDDFAANPPAVSAVGGTASFSNLALNDAADNYTITATASGVTADTSAPFDVTARSLAVTTVMANQRSGDTFSLTVQARDGNNNAAENYNSGVTLGASAAGGSNFTTIPTAIASAGTATFNSLILRNAANGYVITASSTVGFARPNFGSSNVFDVTASHLAVLNIGENRSGDGFAVTVEGRDVNNSVAENFTGSITISASAAGGSNFANPAPSNTMNATAGTATFSGRVLNNAANNYTVNATSSGVTSANSNSFDVTARSLVITTVMANRAAGSLFDVAVQARDGDNNLAENFNGQVTLTADAPGTGDSSFASGNTVNAVAGNVTFDDVALNNAADGYVVTASSTAGVTDPNSALSNSFNVTAGNLHVVNINEVRAGDNFNVVVEARDANSNVAENFTGSVTISASAAGGSNFANSAGTNTANAIAGSTTFSSRILNNAANNYTVSATTTTPGLPGDTSDTFDVTTRSLVITQVLANRVAGSEFDVLVEARDGNNNIAENFNGATFLNADAPGTGDSNFSGGSPAANGVAGNVTFDDVALNNAANGYVITASSTAGVTDPNSALSNSFNVTASGVAVLQVANVKSGEAFSATVRAVDADGNAAENYTGLMGLTVSPPAGGSGFASAPPSENAVAGEETFENLVLSNAADGYTLTGSASGLPNGSSNTFNVTATHLVIATNIPDMAVDDVFDVTVQARDANGNIAENFASTVSLSAAAVGGSDFDGGPLSTPASGGVATFENATLDDAATGYQLTASHKGFSPAMSNTFDVDALEVSRTLGLNLRKHLTAKGMLNATGPDHCEHGRNVKIQKRRANGKWTTLKNATTNSAAAYSVAIPDKPGKYRALAPPVALESPTSFCAVTKSPVKTHAH